MNKSVQRIILASVLLVSGLVGPQSVSAQTHLEKTTVTYRKIDGHEILADVFRPKGNAIRPVIVSIHGGALIMGNRVLDSPELRKYLAEHPDYPYFDVLAFAEEKGYA